MPTTEEIFEHALHCRKVGDNSMAMDKLDRVLLADSNHVRAWAVRASILAEKDRHFDAVLNYDRAIAITPLHVYLNNKATSLVELDQWEAGEKWFREALKVNPAFATAWNNLARNLLIRGRLDEAIFALDTAIKIEPDYADAHLGKAFVLLELGRFEEGWKEYEWRKKLLELHPVIQRNPDGRGGIAKEWIGQKLNDGEAVLLQSEQGIGDAIQFCRYAPLIKKQYGGNVYIEARPSVMRLLRSLQGIDGIISWGDPVPSDVKYSQRLLSCPLIFEHFSEHDFPRSQSYLQSPPRGADIFKKYTDYFSPKLKKVGICWAGNATLPGTDRRRSTNLSMWEPLAQVQGIGWVSLQKGSPAVQVKQTHIGMTIIDVINECDDLADTAGLIMNCDLVISVDTAISHLAAALGKPTWVLSRRDACWRWLGDRKDSPWYPSVRHYRQRKFNDWPDLMQIVAKDLEKWVKDSERLTAILDAGIAVRR